MIQEVIHLTDEQILAGFVASCIESVATRLNCPPSVIWDRMNAVHLVDEYLFRHYDVLHTESRESITLDVIDTLQRWEAEKGGV